MLKCKFLGPKPEFSVWRLETCTLKATLNDCFVQESFRIRVRSLLVARDRNSVQSSLSIKGLYACGIKKGKGMSLPSGGSLIWGSNYNIFYSASCGLA